MFKAIKQKLMNWSVPMTEEQYDKFVAHSDEFVRYQFKMLSTDNLAVIEKICQESVWKGMEALRKISEARTMCLETRLGKLEMEKREKSEEEYDKIMDAVRIISEGTTQLSLSNALGRIEDRISKLEQPTNRAMPMQFGGSLQ